MTGLDFKVREEKAWCIAAVRGRIDTVTASQAEKEAMSILTTHSRMALEMSELEYLSSAGLRVLLRLAKQAEKEGRDFALAGAAGIVREVLEESGLGTFLPQYEDIAELP